MPWSFRAEAEAGISEERADIGGRRGEERERVGRKVGD